ncbi:disulfide-isomerase [Thraustotheca clavata]|uniref:Protein disulfide-isomerase n=1 Tax=Thraustotheca clavata TaxID=74557 RepID=A0A1V9YW66_9STRA|nr:disulfide-isomerase [Thraustotheca clavata]
MRFFGTVSTLLLLGVAAVRGAIEEEDDVLVLTDDNFEEAINTHDTLLVEFYAPWCGHCKSLAPEYAKAAKALKENDPPLRLAKMDATAHTKFSEKYGVNGFPTLKFFKGSLDASAVKSYDSGRSADEIEKWVVKKSGPAVKVIDTADDLAKLQENNDVVVIAHIDAATGEQKDLLEKVADSEDIAVIVATTDASVHADLKEAGSVVLLKKFDDKKVLYDGEFTKEKISDFIKEHHKPLVMTFSQDKASQIFGGEVDVHLLVFSDETKDYHESILESVTEAAAVTKGKILHVVIPVSESRIVDYFGLKESDLPSMVLVNMGAGMKKYPFPTKAAELTEKLTTADLKSFESKYLAGDLKPTLKSAEPFDDSEEAVKVISGKEFDARVMDSDKDVLLEFYAPWCGHCKSLAPKYDELAESFSEVDSIVIAKMDATENEIDHPKVDVKGFPTIIFFPADDKANPITYEGAREVEGFTEFLKKNAKKFTLGGESHGKDHDEL